MYYFDKKYLYIILVILGLYFLTSAGQATIIGLLLSLPGVIFAMTVHEYAHAKMADHYGDTTARKQGRLTLNPLAHIDPIGIFLLIVAHIGWGRPVEVNYNNLTSNKSRGYCEAMISLAGPLANFILATIFTIIFYLIEVLAPAFVFTEVGYILMQIIYSAIVVNIGLGVFNLIPLPPLDGEKIFRNIMPGNVRAWFTRNTNILQFIFLMLWITNLLSYVVNPVIEGVFWLINMVVRFVFGIFI